MTDILKASYPDYTELQGGMPTVTRRGRLYEVLHDYLPEGQRMVATSTRDPNKSEEVVYEVSSGFRSFLADLLWRHHGQPCEDSTTRSGGSGRYERR